MSGNSILNAYPGLVDFLRLICLVEQCSKKTLGNARSDYGQILTIIKNLNNRPTTYLESDLIEPVTPDKPLFRRSLLYANTEQFDAKTEETS